MILALDVGNTNIEIGILYKEKNNFSIKAKARFFTRTEITSDELGVFLLQFLDSRKVDPGQIERMIFSSVVPSLDGIIENMHNTYFKGSLIRVSSQLNLGFTNGYKNPRETGSDRLVNVAYVHHHYKKDAVIVDMGTATNICVVTGKGVFLGGVIIPGMGTSLNALVERARKLPPVKIEKKDKIVADNTVDALESGIYYSTFYALQGVVRHLAEEAGFTDYITVASGGFSSVFSETGLFDYIEKSMALKGLKVIDDLNSN